MSLLCMTPRAVRIMLYERRKASKRGKGKKERGNEGRKGGRVGGREGEEESRKEEGESLAEDPISPKPLIP